MMVFLMVVVVAIAGAEGKSAEFYKNRGNEHFDKGEIVFQAKCKVAPEDTAEVVASKIHTLEYTHLPQIIKQVLKRL